MGLVGVLHKGEEVGNRWEGGKEGEQERKGKGGGLGWVTLSQESIGGLG